MEALEQHQVSNMLWNKINEGKATIGLTPGLQPASEDQKRDEGPLNYNEMQKHTLTLTCIAHARACLHTQTKEMHMLITQSTEQAAHQAH